MKRTILAVLSLCASVSMMAQGWVLFQNKNTTPAVNAPVVMDNAGVLSPVPGGGAYTAELWGGLSQTSLMPLYGSRTEAGSTVTGAISTLITGSSGIFAGKSWQVLTIGGSGVNIPPAVDAFFQVRVRDTASGSWANRAMEGSSAIISVKLGDLLPAALAGNGFGGTALALGNIVVAPVPEPSILALGVLGMGALLLFRRRS